MRLKPCYATYRDGLLLVFIFNVVTATSIGNTTPVGSCHCPTNTKNIGDSRAAFLTHQFRDWTVKSLELSFVTRSRLLSLPGTPSTDRHGKRLWIPGRTSDRLMWDGWEEDRKRLPHQSVGSMLFAERKKGSSGCESTVSRSKTIVTPKSTTKRKTSSATVGDTKPKPTERMNGSKTKTGLTKRNTTTTSRTKTKTKTTKKKPSKTTTPRPPTKPPITSKDTNTPSPHYWNDKNNKFITTWLPPSSPSSHTIALFHQQTNMSIDDGMDTETKKDETPRLHVRFTVRGNPLPLQRHRMARGYTYNPSASKQAEFRGVVLDAMERNQQTLSPSDDSNSNNKNRNNDPIISHPRLVPLPTTLPIFPEHRPISITLLFRMKRPKSHFINSTPGHNRLKLRHRTKADALSLAASGVRSDVDNLTKLVLDSLNGVLYEDDKQVVLLKAMKVMDWEGECLGATEVMVEELGGCAGIVDEFWGGEVDVSCESKR